MDSKNKYISFGEYAEQRNISTNTLSAYVKKHPEIDKHIKHIGKKAYIPLDSEGYELLDKQYPLPQPVQVVQGVPEEEHRKLQAQYIKALEMISRLQENNAALLEDKQRLLTDQSEQQKEKEKAVAAIHEIQLKAIRADSQHRRELEELRQEIRRLKSRGFWARLFNKKV